MGLFTKKPKLLAGPEGSTPETATTFMMRLSQIKDLDLPKLEKFIELKNKEDERLAKKEWDIHFAEMQMDYVPVAKTKEVQIKAGKRMYKYAPLEEILKVYQPILSKHGFSYHFDQEDIEAKTATRIWCIVSGYGHDGKTFVDVPVMPADDYANSTQQIGSAISYAKRYAFVNMMGIIFDEEDDDGRTATQKSKPVYEDAEIEQPEPEKADFVPRNSSARTPVEAQRDCAALLRELGKGETTIALGSLMNLYRKDAGKVDGLAALIKASPKPITAERVAEIEAKLKG